MAADGVGAARPPRDRARPPRRRLDGRHDRPDDRGPAPRAGPVADVDHVEHRQPLARPARAADLPQVPAPGLHRPRDLHRRDRGALRHHRLARLRPRSRRPARPPRPHVRPRPRCAARSRRQLAAILASGDRTAELRRITAPTLVIHGTTDRLVAPSGGRATARAIPGARLLMIEGMGHDLPRGAWPQLIDAIVENTRRAPHPPGDRRLPCGRLVTAVTSPKEGVAMKRVLGTVRRPGRDRRARRRRQRVGQAVVAAQAPRARTATTGRPSPSSSTPPATPRPTRVPPATASATSSPSPTTSSTPPTPTRSAPTRATACASSPAPRTSARGRPSCPAVRSSSRARSTTRRTAPWPSPAAPAATATPAAPWTSTRGPAAPSSPSSSTSTTEPSVTRGRSPRGRPRATAGDAPPRR